MSLSSLQAGAALLDVGLRAELLPGLTATARTGTGLKASLSKDAALTLGGVKEAAAQPIATPTRVQPCAGLDPGCEHTARCGRYVTGVADCIGVTAAVGLSWLWHAAVNSIYEN